MTIAKIELMVMVEAIYWTTWEFVTARICFVQDCFARYSAEQTIAASWCNSDSVRVVSLFFESSSL